MPVLVNNNLALRLVCGQLSSESLNIIIQSNIHLNMIYIQCDFRCFLLLAVLLNYSLVHIHSVIACAFFRLTYVDL